MPLSIVFIYLLYYFGLEKNIRQLTLTDFQEGLLQLMTINTEKFINIICKNSSKITEKDAKYMLADYVVN